MSISIHMTDDYVLKNTFNKVKNNMSKALGKAKKAVNLTGTSILAVTLVTSLICSNNNIYVPPEEGVFYQEEYEYRAGRKREKQEQYPL
ncbi:hypothetical protein AN639_09895 [Candidatus Epulonipiscium fishelsonii]|uniref:Uncharacterized protein n=1 Tax=Candidatus Epulonipiscium fishelsonii TaxID=77094 RepID=A0ACC8XGI1_9FIRM|nr:hypothetical protein AN396_01660 [Epulopiscium sp. SCG-B11WGA-EpuloA1]ONI43817.1 hypothetical protein AN639_09895 [Epulopiscium sp. SCG-B05WGA-EpuloA1]